MLNRSISCLVRSSLVACARSILRWDERNALIENKVSAVTEPISSSDKLSSHSPKMSNEILLRRGIVAAVVLVLEKVCARD